jgi:hypothetical protein
MLADRQRDFATDENAYQSTRREAIRVDLVTRLRRICANLSEEEFNKLVDAMIEQKLRSERRSL